MASFRATLEEARGADVLLHIVDASHPDWEGQMQVVEGVLGELGLTDRSQVPVFNKIDRLADPTSFAARVRQVYPDALLATTMRTDGLSGVKARLRELYRAGRVTVIVRVPVADGALLAGLYRDGEVLEVMPAGEVQEVTVRLEPWRAQRLKEQGVAMGVSAAPTRATG